MRDLLIELLNAKKIKAGWSVEKLLEITINFKDDSLKNEIYWDYKSGDDNICGLAINKKLVAYLHKELPICFYLKEFKKYKATYSDILWFVKTEDFDKDEWFINLKKLQELVPEIQWDACIDAVDPASFSVDGFKYATH